MTPRMQNSSCIGQYECEVIHSYLTIIRERERGMERGRDSWLVSWCFEPSQPQGITLELRGDRERKTDSQRRLWD